jgi:hypothetical protein
VLVVSTHCFDKSLMQTVTRDNVNPIEVRAWVRGNVTHTGGSQKAERTALIVASTIHGQPPRELVRDTQLDRVSTYSPKLFIAAAAATSADGMKVDDDHDDDDKE